jgi:hypothetical protein
VNFGGLRGAANCGPLSTCDQKTSSGAQDTTTGKKYMSKLIANSKSNNLSAIKDSIKKKSITNKVRECRLHSLANV